MHAAGQQPFDAAFDGNHQPAHMRRQIIGAGNLADEKIGQFTLLGAMAAPAEIQPRLAGEFDDMLGHHRLYRHQYMFGNAADPCGETAALGAEAAMTIFGLEPHRRTFAFHLHMLGKMILESIDDRQRIGQRDGGFGRQERHGHNPSLHSLVIFNPDNRES